MLAFSIPTALSAQSISHHPVHSTEEHHTPHFRAALIIGHTIIPALESKDYAAIPSWGLDLEYWPTAKFGIGLHNDLEIANFIIEQDHEEFLEREYPLVLTLDALYKPWKGLVIQAGPGMEIDATERFLLFRLGLEYEFELNHHWDIFPTLFYDAREDAYHTWSIGLGAGKRF
jgi:hypothetical protein